MRKTLLIIAVLFLSQNTSFAEDEVYLDLNIPDRYRYDVGNYRYENEKSDSLDDVDENYLKPSIKSMWKMFQEDVLIKDKKSDD